MDTIEVPAWEWDKLVSEVERLASVEVWWQGQYLSCQERLLSCQERLHASTTKQGGEMKQQCPFCPAKVKHTLGQSIVKCLCGKWLEVWRKGGQR